MAGWVVSELEQSYLLESLSLGMEEKQAAAVKQSHPSMEQCFATYSQVGSYLAMHSRMSGLFVTWIGEAKSPTPAEYLKENTVLHLLKKGPSLFLVFFFHELSPGDLEELNLELEYLAPVAIPSVLFSDYTGSCQQTSCEEYPSLLLFRKSWIYSAKSAGRSDTTDASWELERK